MIKLDRTLIKPPASWAATVGKALHDLASYQRAARDFELLDLACHDRRSGFSTYAPHCLRKRQGKPYFPSIWGQAKEALAKMTNDKCSYCEGGINSARSGQVEHFKPKSLFPSLAYDWDNYFLACGGCNGAKGNQWPAAEEYLRPDRKDPAKHIHFKIDGTVSARKTSREAGVTIEHFDLNRAWLVRRRKKHLKDMVGRMDDMTEVYKLDRALAIRLARKELGRLKDPANVYSAALTQCFLLEWKSTFPHARL
jgi:uncharacterized protein (TIGR02646 family)